MKKLLASLAILLAFAGSAYAVKYTDYLSLKVAYANGSAGDLGNGFNGIGARAAIGGDYKSNAWLNYRGEFEVSYFAQRDNGITLAPIGASINFYADFGTKDWMFKPYIGAGLNGGLFTARKSDPYDTSAAIGYNAQIGMTFNMANDLKLDVGYRYDVLSTLDFTLHNNNIFAGVRWYFD